MHELSPTLFVPASEVVLKFLGALPTLWGKQPPPVLYSVYNSAFRQKLSSVSRNSRHLTWTFLSSLDVFLRSFRFHADINSAKGPPCGTKTRPASECKIHRRAPVREPKGAKCGTAA